MEKALQRIDEEHQYMNSRDSTSFDDIVIKLGMRWTSDEPQLDLAPILLASGNFSSQIDESDLIAIEAELEVGELVLEKDVCYQA